MSSYLWLHWWYLVWKLLSVFGPILISVGCTCHLLVAIDCAEPSSGSKPDRWPPHITCQIGGTLTLTPYHIYLCDKYWVWCHHTAIEVWSVWHTLRPISTLSHIIWQISVLLWLSPYSCICDWLNGCLVGTNNECHYITVLQTNLLNATVYWCVKIKIF